MAGFIRAYCQDSDGTKNNIYVSKDSIHVLKVDKSSRDKRFPYFCLLYTSPSPRDRTKSRMPSSA